jgi:hypothetical protein
LVYGTWLLVGREIQGWDRGNCGRFGCWPVISATRLGVFGIDLAEKQVAQLPASPSCVKNRREEAASGYEEVKAISGGSVDGDDALSRRIRTKGQ